MLQSIMLNKPNFIIFFIVCLFPLACGTKQGQIPTPLPSYTPPNTATASLIPEILEPTSAPEIVETSTITPTATPLPVCNPGTSVESEANSSLPGYIDILNVSTKLNRSQLTVTFTMSWLPDAIGINRDIISFGSAEIAWGVAVDVDNDPATGSSISLIDSGYGYEYALQAINYKQGEEQQGDIETLFTDKIHIWEYFLDGSSNTISVGKMKVDTSAATLTLSGNIKDITRNSYLHFFAVYFPTDKKQLTDELCQR
ncbi:MAG: hypothetical protein Fur0017_15420 [Anaerolineales bacterium]